MNLGDRVLAVSGLASETRIARRPGVAVLAGGGDGRRLTGLIEEQIRAGVRAMISFGIAGGLQPGVKPGTVLIANAVHDGTTRLVADPAWVADLVSALPGAQLAEIAGVDEAVCDVSSKAELHARTGARAADMESHIVGRLATRHGLPFAALRVVSDPAERALPPAALAGMAPDGSTDVGAVLLSLFRKPGQLPGLIRTALDFRAALDGLEASRRKLSPHLAFGRRNESPSPATTPQG